MISVAEARARILAAVKPLPAETVSVAEAVGRVTASDIVARRTQPPMAVSAMDGWACRSADVASVPAKLKEIGYVPAGASFDGTVGAGQAVRIFTGAPVPQGADCIVIQEDVDASGKDLTVREGAKAGAYVRPAGLDFKQGEVGVPAGRRRTPADIGLVAAMNWPWVEVHRRPRIAMIATGDELARPGEPIGPNQIVSSNALALAALIREAGGIPIDLGIAKDEEASLAALADGARGADMLVTLGGASVGEHDLVRKVLGARGLALDFWRIAMRPGKPLMFGRIENAALLGLPGNPVSSLVCATLFLVPALRALQGERAESRPPLTAKLGRDLPANDGREDYLRSTLSFEADGTAVATPFEKQDSSMLSRLARADCLVVRAPHAPAAQAGSRVPIVPLGPFGAFFG
jgi:molybdopterin molybdotransferase